jgi:uncharacterized membrane protein
MSDSTDHSMTSTGKRLLVALLFGLLAAAICILAGAAKFAVLAAWDTTVLVYGAWVWLTVWTMSTSETKSHAIRENPGRAVADILLISASIASLVAVIILIVDASSNSGATKAVEIGLGLVSIILSWGMVHTTYMLKYARLYYDRTEGGVDFNEHDSPRYTDFAYLAFTLGMTFQVSDTDLQTKEIRATALKHALLSYLFGTVIIATTINTLASLSS